MEELRPRLWRCTARHPDREPPAAAQQHADEPLCETDTVESGERLPGDADARAVLARAAGA